MPILGAHMSIAGGYFKAVRSAADLGMTAVQLFTRNNNQWRARPITSDEVGDFRRALADTKIRHTLAHASYLINLASPDRSLWKKSADAMVEELHRAGQLGIPYVVVHPGAYTTGTESGGIQRIIDAIDSIHDRTGPAHARCLLENTAGQGTCLGWRFEHLAAIIDGTRTPERLGVCIDTCHAFAAGYPLAPRQQYLATIRRLDRTVGLERVTAFHVNDSARDLGSHVDRHAHIGQGKMGLAPFRHLLGDRRFRSVPMILETPKGTDEATGGDLDAMNLAALRTCAGTKGPRSRVSRTGR